MARLDAERCAIVFGTSRAWLKEAAFGQKAGGARARALPPDRERALERKRRKRLCLVDPLARAQTIGRIERKTSKRLCNGDLLGRTPSLHELQDYRQGGAKNRRRSVLMSVADRQGRWERL